MLDIFIQPFKTVTQHTSFYLCQAINNFPENGKNSPENGKTGKSSQRILIQNHSSIGSKRHQPISQPRTAICTMAIQGCTIMRHQSDLQYTGFALHWRRTKTSGTFIHQNKRYI